MKTEQPLQAPPESTEAKSKRGALRFPGFLRLCHYKTSDEEAQAKLVDISTDGCAITEPTTSLTLEEKILFTLELENEQEPIALGAVVVRIEGEFYGLRFLTINEQVKNKIRRFFALEKRKRLGS